MLCAPSMKFETLEQECYNSIGYLPSNATQATVQTYARRNPFNVLVKNGRDFAVDNAGVVENDANNKAPIDRFTNATTLVHPENLNQNSYRHFIQKSTASAGITAYALHQPTDKTPH